jgi:hypothetical protein
MRPWLSVVRTACQAAFSGLLMAVVVSPSPACTTAVITGKATADGRPLLWKSRDTTGLPRNEVVVYEGERFRVLAVVNAGDRDEVWMGVNSTGFCIENSLSRDLAVEGKKRGPGNGAIMKLALETCATVEDFRQLLEQTDETGRRTVGNFGVIDAAGGAALFEAGPETFQMFDANDPEVAPRGYIVRANFATTARGVPGLFARNERVVCVFDDAAGRPFVLVLVGATIVGSMATVWHGLVNPPRPGAVRDWHYAGDQAVRLDRGAEMGRFLLGSTVVLLFTRAQLDGLQFNPAWAPGGPIRMGEAMAA